MAGHGLSLQREGEKKKKKKGAARVIKTGNSRADSAGRGGMRGAAGAARPPPPASSGRLPGAGPGLRVRRRRAGAEGPDGGWAATDVLRGG